MKKNILIVVFLCMFFTVPKVYAETEIYSIQLGVYKIEANADRCIGRMKQNNISAFKISTSIHSVFYGTYESKKEALKDLGHIRKHMSSAYVVKLSNKQRNVYLKDHDVSNENVADATMDNSDMNSDIEMVDEEDSLQHNMIEKKQQITINKTVDNNLEYTYRVMNDIELRGIKGESKWFFQVDEELAVKDFKLNLFMRVNELIKTDTSYATIYINNVPTKSMNFKNLDNQLQSKCVVDIPTSLIKKGYNELKILTHSRISDAPCEDDKNIANWIIIDESTNYVLKYDRNYYSDRIANFPKPFIGIQADDDKGVGIVIPNNYTEKEMSAALTLIAYMKDFNLGYETPTTLITANNNTSTFDSLIYVGNYKSVPEGLKKLINNQGSIDKNNAHIYRKSLEKKPVFMIVSDNGTSLLTAVKALKNNDLKAQMINPYVSLDKDFDVSIKEEKQKDMIYLKDLGLNGIEVKGSNQQYTSIGFKIPFNEILANDASINLNMRYSDNIDFEKSMVSIYLNGVPIGSHKLDRNKRNLDSITFSIPEALRQNSYYDIRIVFELVPSGIIDCERSGSVPWAYIQEDSSFFIPSIENPLMLLDNFPYPFSRNDDLDKTTIVLPDQPTIDDLELAGMLAALTGVGTKKNKGIINAIKGSMLSEKYYDDNLIIFGTPKENSAIKTINNDLWFKYNGNFNRVLSNEKMELLPEFSNSATFIELKPSFYNEDKGILSITSLDKKSIIDATKYLYEKSLKFLTGDAVIISKDGDLHTFRFQKDIERPKVKTSILSDNNMKNYIIISASFIIFLLIGLGLFLIKNRRAR